MRGSTTQLDRPADRLAGVAMNGGPRWLKAGLLSAVAAGVFATLHPLIAAGERVEDDRVMRGGEWGRGPNITTPEGEPMPRQEHAVVNLEGFIYGINGIVPASPTPEPTAAEPDPEDHAWGRATTVYIPPRSSLPTPRRPNFFTSSVKRCIPRPITT